MKSIYQTIHAFSNGTEWKTGRLEPGLNFDQAVAHYGRTREEVLGLFARYNNGERWMPVAQGAAA